MVFAFNWGLLPPANEVCEGYVFTPVCQAFCSQGGGACMVGGGVHAWGVGGMHGLEACVAGGVGGMHGSVGWACVAEVGHAWQGGVHDASPQHYEIRLVNVRAVRILQECILVFNFIF